MSNLDDYADLRALAEAALAEKAGNEGMLAEMRRKRQFLPRWIDDSRQAEYRTAANPARILALLADLDAAREQVARVPVTGDYADLAALAEAAALDTAQPWIAVEGTAEDDAQIHDAEGRWVAWGVIDTDEELVRPVNPTLAFIAAADPARIRALLADLDALAAKVEATKDALGVSLHEQANLAAKVEAVRALRQEYLDTLDAGEGDETLADVADSLGALSPEGS